MRSRLTPFVEWYATHFDFTLRFAIRMFEVLKYGLLVFFLPGDLVISYSQITFGLLISG